VYHSARMHTMSLFWADAIMHDRLLRERAAAGAPQDMPLPIGHSQTISAPHMHATALELLADRLQPGANVLDVGSGAQSRFVPSPARCCMSTSGLGMLSAAAGRQRTRRRLRRAASSHGRAAAMAVRCGRCCMSQAAQVPGHALRPLLHVHTWRQHAVFVSECPVHEVHI